MTRRACCAGGIAWLTACRQPEPRTLLKAIVGGLAIDPGGETFLNSVILVAGSHFLTVGPGEEVTVPPGTMSWSAQNRFVVPAPVGLEPGRVALPKIGTAAQCKAVMINAPEAVEGIVSDADELPDGLVKRLARADTIVTPRLAHWAESPVQLERALRHTRTLMDAGVRLASFGDRDALTEWRLLAKAGLTPRQVLESATVHAARVARLQDTAGSLRAGYRASLWILRSDPLADTDHLGSVDAIMLDGAWQRDVGGRK